LELISGLHLHADRSEIINGHMKLIFHFLCHVFQK